MCLVVAPSSNKPFHPVAGVDAEFEALLCSICSSDFVDSYKRQFPVGWVNLMTDFESRKRAASPFKTTSFNVSLPFTFISEFRKHRVSGWSQMK